MMLPPEAVHAAGSVQSNVTVVVPLRENVTDFPPVVYPLAFACSFVRPAYVVLEAPILLVLRKRAIL